MSSSLHAAIAQADMAVDRTGRERLGWIAIAAVRVQEAVSDRGWVELRPFSDANGGRISRAEQNLGRVQLILHRNDVRRKNLVVIVGPYSRGEPDLFQVVDACDRLRFVFGLLQFFGRELHSVGQIALGAGEMLRRGSKLRPQLRSLCRLGAQRCHFSSLFPKLANLIPQLSQRSFVRTARIGSTSLLGLQLLVLPP